MHALPRLPYGFDALEPHIDAQTLQIHYRQHHQAYVDGLIAAIGPYAELQSKSAEDLCREIHQIPAPIRADVRINAGGHWNHSRAWAWMTPNASGAPFGRIATEINNSFESAAVFKARFIDAAARVAGCGWAWLIKDDSGLAIATTANNDNPLMDGRLPILGVDMWEHAYYLKYQNRRADYLKAWWNVINWNEVNRALGTRLAVHLAGERSSATEEV